MTLRRWLAVAAIVVAGLIAAGFVLGDQDDEVAHRVESELLNVPAGPGYASRGQIQLDTSIYVPESANADNPAPAVLLPHGFGGTKHTVAADAADLAEAGYVVVTWTARGFGRSGGNIHLMSPDHEVADAAALVDRLTNEPAVLRDGAGDPRVGVVGSSYGGALALLLAGQDDRVDAIVPQSTWNDLARALFPDAVSGNPGDGVFKQAWSSVLFSAGLAATGTETSPSCGRFALNLCDLYQRAATSGQASDELIALLRQHSPVSVAPEVNAPTLLIQGSADTLFPLGEADVTARQLTKAGTPVRVAWFSGGHDGGPGSVDDEQRIRELTRSWLDHHLWGRGPDPGSSFTFSRVSGADPAEGRVTTVGYESPRYPGLGGGKNATSVPLNGGPTQVVNPAGGEPAAVSSLPGLSELLADEGGPASPMMNGTDVPGQVARFDSEPLTEAVSVTGSPTVSLRVSSSTGDATVFVKIYDVAPDGTPNLVAGHVAPVRLRGLTDGIDAAEPVPVTMPGLSHQFGSGHRVRVAVSATDQAYAGPDEPRVYTVDLAEPAVNLPAAHTQANVDPASPWPRAAAATAGAGALAGLLGWGIGRRRAASRAGASADSTAAPAGSAQTVPLAVSGLSKSYPDGLVAVDEVDFTVRAGEVVGLLGPNGAGKTTTLRMVLGLIRPSAGEITMFGQSVVPGAPVLSRVGALVEGPGFAPHLTGRANLELFWRSTGRPIADAHLDEVLAIAALGSAIDRKVGTYSHGMRQRLAIAQAMLGLPDVLVLDEPTDGLDPPQIVAMRRILRDYAAGGPGGRSVVISSHLLAEVEQTCTHVVVLHQGHRVAAGSVPEVIGGSSWITVEVSDPHRAEQVLAGLPGVGAVAQNDGAGNDGAGNDGAGNDGSGNGGSGDGAARQAGSSTEGSGRSGEILVEPGELSRADVVRHLVDAGVDVSVVSPRRRLEDAFLALIEGDR